MHQAAKRAGRPKPHILQLITDVMNPQSVDESATRIKDAFGRLDILVNNAGHMENWKKIADSDVNEWRTTFTVIVKGTYVVERAMLPLLTSSEDGLKVTINVASIGVHMVDAGGSSCLVSCVNVWMPSVNADLPSLDDKAGFPPPHGVPRRRKR